MIIASDDQLSMFIDSVINESYVVLDTEFIRENTYTPQLCLLQLGTADVHVAVDMLAIQDPEPIKRLLEHENIIKVFHACSQDIEVILTSLGVIPHPIFDTQIAAAYLGWRNQVGYGQLVGEICGVHLPKSQSMTDWTKRPLDEAQLEYALDDVRYLPLIYEKLNKMLQKKNRESWVVPEFEKLCVRDLYIREPLDAWKHLRRINTITGYQLAVAREVASWREITAKERNLPRKKILSDESVIEISRIMPKSIDGLLRIRGTEELSEEDRASLLNACLQAAEIPVAELPHQPQTAKPSIEQESICDLMYALTRLIAKQLNIAPTALASRDDLSDMLKHPETSEVMTGWRYDVLGCRLNELLQGQIGLTVVDGQIELL